VTQDDWQRVQELVEAALQRDPEERDGFLDVACAGKPSLRAAVAALLEAHADPPNLSREARTRQTPATVDASAGSAPHRVGPYIIRQEIARGGMGVVYLAEDTRLSRRVALKALPAALSPDPAARERLRREARAAAALSHPGVATVYALEEIGDQLFLASEYVPGQTLRAILAPGPLAAGQILDLATQLARAMAAAHAHGIVHRDLKPENIILNPAGQVKVLDFGIARVESLAPARLTQTGTIVGTPGYMAPEQAQGLDVDFRTDQFAFGVLLYEMATGSNPFEARTATATIARILQVEPQALSLVRPDGPAGLDRIVERCLRKLPAERYLTTQELVIDLEALPLDAVGRGERTTRRRGLRGSDVQPPQAWTTHAARTWWRTHQVVIMALYVAATAWSWRIGEWYRLMIPPWIFLTIGVGSMLAGTMRGHLLFTDVMNAERIRHELSRSRPLIIIVDVLTGLAIFADGALLISAKPTGSLLTMGLAVGLILASVLMEPATTDAAFPRGREQDAKRKI
jgi:predicted Ser/Thr protein kinase